jgi:Holliday junction resolvase
MLSESNSLERKIKSTTINYLIDKWGLNKDDLVISEFNVGDFSRRVDLVIIKNNKTYAFEIKSKADSLIRLEGQIDKYLLYFDKVFVVAAPNHSKKCIEKTPCNVGVWEVDGEKIKVKRRGRVKLINDKNVFTELATLSEIKRFLSLRNMKNNDKKRTDLEKNLECISEKKIRIFAIDCIINRYKKRSVLFFNSIEGSVVTPENLKHLGSNKTHRPSPNTPNIDSLLQALENIVN